MMRCSMFVTLITINSLTQLLCYVMNIKNEDKTETSCVNDKKKKICCWLFQWLKVKYWAIKGNTSPWLSLSLTERLAGDEEGALKFFLCLVFKALIILLLLPGQLLTKPTVLTQLLHTFKTLIADHFKAADVYFFFTKIAPLMAVEKKLHLLPRCMIFVSPSWQWRVTTKTFSTFD